MQKTLPSSCALRIECKMFTYYFYISNKNNRFVSKFNILIRRENINSLKSVLVEKKSLGKWLFEQLRRNSSIVSQWYPNDSTPYLTTFILTVVLLK